MRAYVGQTRAAELIETLSGFEIGECVVRGTIPPRRTPWFYDNGAYGDWRAGRSFDGVRYLRDIWRIREWVDLPKPDFVVLPDLVAQGAASLAFTAEWLPQSVCGAPLYLAVQDGMTPADVRPLIPLIGGLFVGGSLPWKIRTSAMWVDLAHDCGMPAHVGRVGTFERVQWAKRIGADSIDSCLPLWSVEHLERFVSSLSQPVDTRLFDEVAG